MAQQSTELSLLVLAKALILICGRMDLSLESTIGLAPVIAVWLVLPTSGARFTGLGLLPEWTADPAVPAGRRADRRRQRLPDPQLRLNGFIVTLGMLIMLRGLQIAISEGQSIVELPRLLHLPRQRLLAGHARRHLDLRSCSSPSAAGALAWLRHGRALYAIGGNADAARAAGIRVDRIIWIVLVVGSVLAAFAGLLYSGHYGSGLRRPRATAGSSRSSPPPSSAASASTAARARSSAPSPAS